MNFEGYDTEGFYYELLGKDGVPRDVALPLIQQLNGLPIKDLRRRQKAAE